MELDIYLQSGTLAPMIAQRATNRIPVPSSRGMLANEIHVHLDLSCRLTGGEKGYRMRGLRRGMPVAVGLSMLVLAAIVACASKRRAQASGRLRRPKRIEPRPSGHGHIGTAYQAMQ